MSYGLFKLPRLGPWSCAGAWLAPLLAAGCASLPSFLPKRGDGKVVHSETETCTYLDPEVRSLPTWACEEAQVYALRAGSRQLSFTKAAFQATFRERLFEFVRATDYPLRSLRQATVEFWLAAPTFTPDQAYFEAVIMGPGGNFALRLDLDPAAWRVGEDGLIWLGRDTYPSLAARATGVVVVTPGATVTPGRFKDFIAASGIMGQRTPNGQPAVRRVAGDGTELRLETEPFSELAVARQLRHGRGAATLLGSLSFPPAGDREGYKARVFVFPVTPAE